MPLPSPAFWARVRKGKDVYLHVFVVERGGFRVTRRAVEGEGGGGKEEREVVEVVSLEGHDGMRPLHGVVPLVKRQVRLVMLWM
jgi:hypothetical protein